MKFRILFILLCLCYAIDTFAQDFKISTFQENIFDLTAARDLVRDNNGDVCALIKFFTRDDNFIFEPNLGIVKTKKIIGETWLYVPQQTKRITVRHPQLGIIRNYIIPVEIKSEVVYEAELQITNQEYLHPRYSQFQGAKPDTVYVVVPQEPSVPQQQVKAERRIFFNLGAGFRALGVMGPEAFIGLNIDKHTIEAGAIYGISKVVGISIYQADDGTYWGTYNFRPMRFFMHYGYDIPIGSSLTVTPQLGGAINYITGKEVHRGKGTDLFNKINT
ncbi:MAG: hypothetical protein II470_10910, partial [Selenomonas sp.]|nr:hypothetical protein [Selenomonas sp.]